MVKALGASTVFDYASPTCGADIRAHTRNELYYAFDTVSEAASPRICADGLAPRILGQEALLRRRPARAITSQWC